MRSADLFHDRREPLIELAGAADARILEVFTQAYADVEREFERIFARLFQNGLREWR